MLNDNRIRVIIGHYGSGKTEFAVNYALKLAATGQKVALADLDIVNPYFRSREKADMLEAEGIRVISGAFGHKANLDIPMVAAGIQGPLQDGTTQVILDVGGDSVGARVLARYRQYFRPGDYDMFCVINTHREQTVDAEGAIRHIREIEATAGARVTGLINNTHMLRHTSVEDVLEGQRVVDEVSKVTGIPVRYVSAIESVVEKLPTDLSGELFGLKMYMREDWM